MRLYLVVLVASLTVSHDSSSHSITTELFTNQQDNIAQSPALAEAERLSAQVVKLNGERRYDEALPLAERVLTIREKALGPEHELVAIALRNLSQLLQANRKHKEAAATYQRFLSMYEKGLGADNPKLVEALDHYVCLLVGSNQRDKALEVQKRLYKLDNKFDYDESVNRADRNLAAGGLMIGKKINSPPPVYSAEAKKARAAGSVVMKITIDGMGEVISVKTLCGHPILAKDAEESILKSRYTPTVVAGQAVKAAILGLENRTSGVCSLNATQFQETSTETHFRSPDADRERSLGASPRPPPPQHQLSVGGRLTQRLCHVLAQVAVAPLIPRADPPGTP